MDIYAKEGTKVIFTGCDGEEQIQWGGHKDPRGILTVGQIYTIHHTEVHNMHTKVFLGEVRGSFNSVWFKEIGE